MTSIRVIPASRPLEGTIRCPRDKSLSHRAAMIGALCNGTTRIEGFSFCQDCLSTLRCLERFGVHFEKNEHAEKLVIKSPGLHHLSEPDDILDAGNSGTSIRMLSGIACGVEGISVFTGDESIRKRPMKRIIFPLRKSGAFIAGRGGDRFPPLIVQGKSVLFPLQYALEVPSAQVKSALLFAALSAKSTSRIEEPIASRDHTERMLRYFGVSLSRREDTIYVEPPAELSPRELVLPGDPSSAAFLLCAALLVPGSEVTVTDICLNSTRTGFLRVLRSMGAQITEHPTVTTQEGGEESGSIRAVASRLHSTSFGGEIIPSLVDEIPILAVTATQAEGRTVITGAEELRLKESDRLHAVADGLNKMGAAVEETPDGLIIDGPTPLRGARLQSHGDHRIAMSFLVAALVAKGETEIEGIDCIGISYPSFFKDMETLGMRRLKE